MKLEERLSFKRRVKDAAFRGVAAVERLLPSGRGGRDVPLESIRDFLLMQYPTALGTAIHATPLVPALRAAVPCCRIAVAASGLALEIFRNSLGVDCLIETPSPLRDLKGAIRVLREKNPFRERPFATLTSVGNERTLIGLQTLVAGASLRIGYTEVPQLYRVPLTFDYGRSLIDNNLRMVEALGHPFQHFEPEMFFGPEDLAWARAVLAESGVIAGQPVAVFVTQTSVTQKKGWRKERFQAAARFLMEGYGAHVVFVGTASEAGRIEELREGILGSTTSVAGKTSLTQMAALLSLCDVGLTLDTGTMHVGRTVHLPMVIVAPAWSPPLEWLPLGDPRYRILKNADMEACPPEYIIDEVSVDEVTAALAGLLEEFPPGLRHRD